ncbi:enhanced intracellular survival protein Eis [Rhodococcus aerolatus]
MDVAVRTAGPSDWDAFVAQDERAFGVAYDESEVVLARAALAGGDALVAEADGRVVGAANHFRLGMTVPGGSCVDVPGVSWVSVAATHRRRGVLRELMAVQHRRFLDEGAVLAALTASEATIYGRFGYGAATRRTEWEVDRRHAVLRDDAPDPGGVRYADPEEARAHAPGSYARWAARTPGAITRPAAWWDFLLADRPSTRGGASGLFHLVHPDGWCSYRVRGSRVEVADLVAATDAAHAALWRVLLGLDLADVVAVQSSRDDPVAAMLTDPRLARVVTSRDGLWLRVLDVPRALELRAWAAPVDLVLAVADPFLGRSATVRLVAGPDGARCEATTAEPDLACDVADLGALYLGAHRARVLHAAGRLRLRDGAGVAAVAALDLALTPEREPRHGTGF